MTPEQIDRVFGRGRLKMVTGEHVEVFREAVGPGERRRYTKRFLNSTDGDLAHWTEREWRILARLIGHGITCVPDVVQFDRGSVAGKQHVQTYDAGVTVDQWATLLPLHRGGQLYRHAFEDCAHWWALAHHCLAALKEIHQLQLVHLDIKGDNVCIPLGPADFDPDTPEMPLFPVFRQLALIDFAFSLVSRESLTAPLPIGWQREYDYQSPRLLKALEDGHDGDLRATRELDWRCDIYSLAAMLKRYLPDDATVHQPERATGWTSGRYEAAKALILALREHHDRDAPQVLPHQALIDATGDRLREHDLALSLATGWTFARGFDVAPSGSSPLTPLTRLAVPLRVFVSPHSRAPMRAPAPFVVEREPPAPVMATKRTVVVPAQRGRQRARYAALVGAMTLALGAVVAQGAFPDRARAFFDGARAWLDNVRTPGDSALSSADTAKARGEPVAPEATAARAPEVPPPAAAASAPVPAGATTAAVDSPPAASTTSAVPRSAASTSSADPPPAASSAAADPSPASTAAAGPPSASTETASPQVAKASPRAATPASEAASAPGQRSASRATPPSRAHSPKSVAAAKSPPQSRSAVQVARATPATANAHSSITPESLPEQTPPAQPPSAGTQVAAIAPSQSAAPAPPLQLQPSEANASSSAAVIAAPQLSPPPESRAPAVPAAPPPARSERAPAKSAEPGILSLLFGLAKRTPAPIEDRSTPAGATPGKAVAAQRAPALPQDRASAATPKAEAPAQERAASAVPRIEPQPGLIITFAVDEPPAQARAQTGQAFSPPPARDEPRTSRPEESRAAIMPAPTLALRAWPPPPPPEARPEFVSSERARDSDYALQARRALAQGIPRIAVQAQTEVARVLWLAATALDPSQEQGVIDVAQAVRVRDSVSGMPQAIEPEAARRFNDEALKAYWTRRNIAEAFDLQMKAFGANPNDPEIAGNLAVFHLKVSPSQPETARQLALHALAIRGARYRTGRLEDWNTYAIASALTGRDADAKNALYVTVALARNVDRNCRDAASAIATYGDRMREPVDAMLNRIRIQGRMYDSPHCAWPLRRTAGARTY